MKDRRRIMTIAVAVLLGLLALDRLVVPTLVEGWRARAGRIERLETQLERGQGLLDRERQLAERWGEMVERSLPAREDEAEGLVYQAVADWAREAGVAVASQKSSWVRGESGARRLEFSVVGAGPLEGIARFIHRLETAPHALRVEELSLGAGDERGRVLNLSLRLSGIVLRENSHAG